MSKQQVKQAIFFVKKCLKNCVISLLYMRQHMHDMRMYKIWRMAIPILYLGIGILAAMQLPRFALFFFFFF